MAKTPEEKALDDVRKAAIARDKAKQKHDDLQDRLSASIADLTRAQRVLKYSASHPDLPEDFDVDTFLAADAEDVDPIEPDEGELEAIAAGEAELTEALAAEREFQEGDGGDGAVPAPKPSRGKKAEVVEDDDPFGDL